MLQDEEESGGAAGEEAIVSKSLSSPDIGRKHHTLPPNYKHPPQIKVHRKSSSSSGESSRPVKKSAGERKGRSGSAERYGSSLLALNGTL